MKNSRIPGSPAPRSHRGRHSDNLLTVKDVAERDACSEKTVRRAIEAGLLEVTRVGTTGRLIRIHPDAHAAYRWRLHR